MVVWRELHFEGEQDHVSTERATTDPEVARIRKRLRKRLANAGLLKFLSVRYIRTQATLLTQLVSL